MRPACWFQCSEVPGKEPLSEVRTAEGGWAAESDGGHSGTTAPGIQIFKLIVRGCKIELASLQALLNARISDLKRNPQLTTLIVEEELEVSVDRCVEEWKRIKEEFSRAKLQAFTTGLHGRLVEASRVRMLGHVRGDKDQAHVFGVPLLKAIGEHVRDAAGQNHRAKDRERVCLSSGHGPGRKHSTL